MRIRQILGLTNLDKPVPGFVAQFIRYLFTGAFAFVVDFALLYIFTEIFSLHYRIGTTVGYIAGLAITYTLSVLWIFDEHRTTHRWLELGGFILIGIIGMGATHLCMWVFTDLLLGGKHYLLSKIITTVIVSALNFILKKYILFTKAKL